MRTDSTRVSAEALQAVRGHIDSSYGSSYLPANPHTYASGKSARRPTRRSARPTWRTRRSAWPNSACTAINCGCTRSSISVSWPARWRRPCSPLPMSKFWRRRPAERNGRRTGLFKAQGKVLKFDGYRKVLPPAGKQEDATLPSLTREAETRPSRPDGQPALHAAAAALQRGVAGQGAGKGRHRPAQHLRHRSSTRSPRRSAATSR